MERERESVRGAAAAHVEEGLAKPSAISRFFSESLRCARRFGSFVFELPFCYVFWSQFTVSLGSWSLHLLHVLSSGARIRRFLCRKPPLAARSLPHFSDSLPEPQTQNGLYRALEDTAPSPKP